MTRPGSELALSLRELDPAIADLIEAEERRQNQSLDLVASENFVPKAVLEAQGSVLTNKYADGYPGAREYDGCAIVDAIEELAIERAKALFGAEHANVQAYSGSNANAAVLHALCQPGDVVLGWDFNEGGHPSHYAGETFAGRFYEGFAYGVRKDDFLVDMDEVAALARRHRPKVIFAGWSCYSRHLDFGAFRAIADEVGAYLVCDMAHFAGLVAAKLHPSPVPYADVCTMTVHKTLGGARGGAILCRAELAERIDAAVFPGEQGGPLMQVIAGKAVSFALAERQEFAARMARTIAGARTLAAKLVAAEDETKMHVRTGGTDVHQFHLDVAPSGRDANEVHRFLQSIGMNANAMRISGDVREAPGCSGIRLGSTSLATRGFVGADFELLGDLLVEALRPGADAHEADLSARVLALAESHRV